VPGGAGGDASISSAVGSMSLVEATAPPAPPAQTPSSSAGQSGATVVGVGGSGGSESTGSDAVRTGLAFVSSMLPGFVPKYFGDTRSCAQIRGIECKCICAFDSTSSRINVVCADGTFLVYSFEEKQQTECVRVSSKRFVKDPGELPDTVVSNTTAPLAAASTSETVGTTSATTMHSAKQSGSAAVGGASK